MCWARFFILLLRDYTQDLEAHVAAKSEKITPEQLAMYQDYVAKHYASAAVLGDSVDLEEAQDWASGCFSCWPWPGLVLGQIWGCQQLSAGACEGC